MRAIARALAPLLTPALPRRPARAPGDGRDAPEPVRERARAGQRGDAVRAEGDARARDPEPAPGRRDERDGAVPRDQHLGRRGAAARRRSRIRASLGSTNAAGHRRADPARELPARRWSRSRWRSCCERRAVRARARGARPAGSRRRAALGVHRRARPGRGARQRRADDRSARRLPRVLRALALALARRGRARVRRGAELRHREARARPLAAAGADGGDRAVRLRAPRSTVYDAFIARRARGLRDRGHDHPVHGRDPRRCRACSAPPARSTR